MLITTINELELELGLGQKCYEISINIWELQSLKLLYLDI